MAKVVPGVSKRRPGKSDDSIKFGVPRPSKRVVELTCSALACNSEDYIYIYI